MFGIGWGETFVVVGVGIYLIGRQDLPRASRFAGTQIGRVVGLLQGARVRADRFTAQSELRQLQNELRLGLRELDVVRSEVAVAVSSQGIIGRTLGPTVPGANRQQLHSGVGVGGITANAAPFNNTPTLNRSPLVAPLADNNNKIPGFRDLAPRSQSVAAVAEEEWQKQGIGFQSRAERGMGDSTGSALLSNLYQQTLIFDQHDRAVQEQDEELRSRIQEKQHKPAEEAQS